jgi:hypothetical protein
MLVCGLLVILVYGQTQAQTEQGNWLLGGSGSFQHLKQSVNLTSNQIQLYPKGGFFVMNHLVVGLMPSVEISIVGKDNRTASSPSTYSLSIGPFARYYYPVSSSISLFAEAYATYGTHYTRPKSNMANSALYAWRIGPGVAFFLSPAASLDISVGYGQKNSVSRITGENYTYKTSITDIQLGFSTYLKKK